MKTKRMNTYVIVAMLTMAGLAGCNNEEPLPDGTPPGDGKIRVTATVGGFTAEDGTPETRAYFNSDGTGTFETGDKIAFYACVERDNDPATQSSAHQSTLTYDEGTAAWSTPNLSWSDLKITNPDEEYYLFCGYYIFSKTGAVVTPQDGKAKFSVETDQNGDFGMNYFKSEMFYAVESYPEANKPANGQVPLKFKHVMSCIDLTLKTADGSGIDLSSASVVLKDVKTEIELPLGAVPDEKHATGAGADITMRSTAYGTKRGALVPPQTLANGIKLAITVGGKTTEHTIKGTKGKTLESGTLYPIELTLKDGGATPGGGITTAAELVQALGSTQSQTITIAEDITWSPAVTLQAVTLQADQILNIPKGKTLTASGGATLNANDSHLTITGGGTFRLTGVGSCITIMSSGTVTLDKGTSLNVEKTNDGYASIFMLAGTFNCNGDITAKDTGNGTTDDNYSLITSYGGSVFNLTGTLTLENKDCGGITGPGTLNMQGGTIIVNSDNGGGVVVNKLKMDANSIIRVQDKNNDKPSPDKYYNGLYLSNNLAIGGTTLTAENGAKIIFSPNATTRQDSPLLNDRGTAITTLNTRLTAGASDADPAEDGLSAGEYVWEETAFKKK